MSDYMQELTGRSDKKIALNVGSSLDKDSDILTWLRETPRKTPGRAATVQIMIALTKDEGLTVDDIAAVVVALNARGVPLASLQEGIAKGLVQCGAAQTDNQAAQQQVQPQFMVMVRADGTLSEPKPFRPDVDAQMRIQGFERVLSPDGVTVVYRRQSANTQGAPQGLVPASHGGGHNLPVPAGPGQQGFQQVQDPTLAFGQPVPAHQAQVIHDPNDQLPLFNRLGQPTNDLIPVADAVRQGLTEVRKGGRLVGYKRK